MATWSGGDFPVLHFCFLINYNIQNVKENTDFLKFQNTWKQIFRFWPYVILLFSYLALHTESTRVVDDTLADPGQRLVGTFW